jgi:hypothetical protein
VRSAVATVSLLLTLAVRKEPVEVPDIVSFGEDASGELYAVALADGIVYRLAAP